MFEAARHGFLLALATIILTFLLGAGLRRCWICSVRPPRSCRRVRRSAGDRPSPRMALTIGAVEAEISVAMGTVFLLNAVALYLFPLLGHALGLSQTQFGAWSGIAIHDISSVVGRLGLRQGSPGDRYGREALAHASGLSRWR